MNELALISNPSLKQQIAIAAIKNMMDKSFFSWTPVDDAALVMGKKIASETMQMLQALHCVRFADMTPDVLAFIYEVCNAVCE